MKKIDGLKIRALREARKWSLTDLAIKLREKGDARCSAGGLSLVERCRTRGVNATRVMLLAEVLGVGIEDLFVEV
jgi:transcriptional regulator with XRE-family HTH domain